MSAHHPRLNRRNFLHGAVTAVAASLLPGETVAQQATPEPIANGSVARPLSEKEKVSRIASNSYPIRFLFKHRGNILAKEDTVAEMQKKYGSITMLDFPAYTAREFPGVTKMDTWTTLFGDFDDESMYRKTQTAAPDGTPREILDFDPASSSGRRWCDAMANMQVKTGVATHHISNNAVRNVGDLDVDKRKAGLADAKKWFDAAKILGAKSMRIDSGGPRVMPGANLTAGTWPTNNELMKYLTTATDAYKQMAEWGEAADVKVTIENHWGLTANPINVRYIIEEVNSPYCEASPDYCNWEHEGLLYHGLNDLAPYAHTTVHAKYWDRFDKPDVQRNTRIMLNNGFTGVFALEYEAGPWDGVEGAKYLYREVMAAL